MQNTFKTLKPHLIAILVGLAIIFTYFPSVFLESKVIDMGDINRSSATSKQTRDFREETGIEPLWTNSQFGGMPTYQMNVHYPDNLITHLERFTKQYLPSKLGLIFIIFLSFYFISVFLGVRVWVSILGAFAFAFSTYFIISMEAGHTGKLRAIGYIAPVMVGVIMTMRGKYLLGGALTTLFLTFSINANHFQISYYMALMILTFLIVEAVYHVKEKEFKKFVIKIAVLGAAALLAVGPNISRLWTTYDYAKETMRGGRSELKEYKDAKSGGLEKDYAFSWSYGIAETFTLLIPDFYGGSSTASLKLNSNTGEELKKRGLPKNQLKNIMKRLPVYWGDQPFTSGPVYLGAAIIFLFVLSLFVLHGRIKVWLLTCTIFSIVLSWGNNFETVNDLFFYYFPLYNKFRTPSMILSITSLSIPLLGVMALNKILQSSHGIKSYMPEIKKAFYITGGISLFIMLFGSSLFSFSSNADTQLPEGWPIESLIEDRKDLMTYGAFKSLIFISVCFALILAYAKSKISKNFFIAGMLLCVGLDLWMVDKNYLNDSNLIKRKNRDAFYVDTQADKIILQDKDPNFRVFNLSTNPFTDAMTSFHHHSVGGYHGAKLIRYQDMIDKHLSKNNTKVLDMLNTKYYIIRNQENGQPEVKGNRSALGNAWFINQIKWADNADEEIDMLNEFNPGDEVVIDKRYSDKISKDLSLDNSSNSIQLVQYQPNKLTYETNVSGGKQFAVFSEIYYEGTDNDWKVYIDGDNPSSHIRVNYILRGMEIPEGKHTVEFRFEPVSYFFGERLSLGFSIVVLIIVAGAFFLEFRNYESGKEKEMINQ